MTRIHFNHLLLLSLLTLTSPSLCIAQDEKPTIVGDETKEHLTVTNQGAEPRAPLRYECKPGTKGTLVTIRTESQETVHGDRSYPATMRPTHLITFEGEIRSNEQDTVTADFTVQEGRATGHAGINRRMLGIMNAQYDAIEGLGFELSMNTRGAGQKMSLNVAEDTGPVMQSFLEQQADRLLSMRIPFPEQPIGVGGEWQIVRTIRFDGVEVEEIRHYRLAERTGRRVTIEIELTRVATEQELELAIDDEALRNMPPEMRQRLKSKVLSYGATTTGRITTNLDQWVDAELELKTKIDRKVQMGTAQNAPVVIQRTTRSLEVLPASVAAHRHPELFRSDD